MTTSDSIATSPNCDWSRSEWGLDGRTSGCADSLGLERQRQAREYDAFLQASPATLTHESCRLVHEVQADTVWILALVRAARLWPPTRP